MKKYLQLTIVFLFCGSILYCKKEAPSVAVNGKEVFNVHCQSCHGESGHGDGPVSDTMGQKPRNYALEGFKYGKDFKSVATSIEKGFPEAGMPGYKDVLSKNEIEAVAKYVLDIYITQ